MSGYDPRTLPVAVVGRPHGNDGEVFVRTFADGSQVLAFEPPFEVVLESEAGERAMTVTAIRPAANAWLATFAGVDTRELAGALTGATVRVERAALPPLEPGEYYIEDLIGANVVGEGGEPVGVVRGLLWNGAHEIMSVEPAAGGEILVPVVPAFVLEVEAEARRVRIVVPEEETFHGREP